jgi:hypothetical protein
LGEQVAPLLDTMREWEISQSDTRAEQTALTSET